MTPEPQVSEQTKERLLQWMLDSSPALWCVIDTEGRFLLVNDRRWKEVTGWGAYELIGQPAENFILDPAASRQAIQRNIEAGEVTPRFRNAYKCRDGGLAWIVWTYFPFDMDEPSPQSIAVGMPE